MTTVGITKFAERQLASDFGGTRLTSDDLDFCVHIAKIAFKQGDVKDGYAPFCKTIRSGLVGNILSPIVEVTPENEHLLRTKYQARQEGELPVLVRYFVGIQRKPAHHLNIILYSREQLLAEDAATGKSDTPDADWSIVAVNAEPGEIDSPIPPVTMMRNALGKTEGGSGFPLDRTKYMESVAYWSRYAQVE